MTDMRKIACAVRAFSIVFAAVFAVACRHATSAGEAAKQYAEYIAAGEYDKFVEAVYIPSGTSPEDIELSRAMLNAVISGAGAEMLTEKGGLKSVKLVSEESASEEDPISGSPTPEASTFQDTPHSGIRADIVLLYTFGNGEISEETMSLVLDNGVWKIDMGI